MTTARLPAQIRGDLSAAAHWRLLGLLLERPRSGWHEEVLCLMGEQTDPAPGNDLKVHVRNATEGVYLAILGPGGAVSPREVTYQPMQDPGLLLADLRELYESFAFAPQIEEPIDHIATEAGFVGYMMLKRAYARACAHEEAAVVTDRAVKRFLSEHLRSFAAAFADRLGAASDGYLSATAAALHSRVQRELAGVDAG